MGLLNLLRDWGESGDAARALVIGVALVAWIWWRLAGDFRLWLKER